MNNQKVDNTLLSNGVIVDDIFYPKKIYHQEHCELY